MPDALGVLRGIADHSSLLVGDMPRGYGISGQFLLSALTSLVPNTHVTDEVINARVDQLNARTARLLQQGVGVPRVLLFPTWFMAKLVPDPCGGRTYNQSSYADAAAFLRTRGVRNAMSALSPPVESVLQCQRLLAPCFIPSVSMADTVAAAQSGDPAVGHWVLLLADVGGRTIYTIDPLQARTRGGAPTQFQRSVVASQHTA